MPPSISSHNKNKKEIIEPTRDSFKAARNSLFIWTGEKSFFPLISIWHPQEKEESGNKLS